MAQIAFVYLHHESMILYRSRVCIKGNVDCVKTLVDKSNSIHAGINSVNYRVFLEAMEEFGHYTLSHVI